MNEPHDQRLAEILVAARYTLLDQPERRLEQLAHERQLKTGNYHQAYMQVLNENPQLYVEYQEARARAAKGTMFEKTMSTSHRQKPRTK